MACTAITVAGKLEHRVVGHEVYVVTRLVSGRVRHYPHVYFKRQPFYHVLATLLPATSLKSDGRSRCNKSFHFQFLPYHVNEIFKSMSDHIATGSEFWVEVHLRLCLDDRLGEQEDSYQEDSYPAGLTVKVNDQACVLPASIPVLAPGGATMRVRLPVNIISSCFLYPGVKNKLSLSWQREWDREYVVGVFLVRKQSAATILRELQQRKAPNTAMTTELIKEQERASGGGDIAVTSFQASLTCPLSKKRMSVPCRALGCKHIQCFDAPSYLQINETRPTWMCPVCGRRAAFFLLFVDQLFKEIVEKAPAECDSVLFRKDGSWTPSASPKDGFLAGKAWSLSARSSKGPSASSSNEHDGWPNKRRKTKFVDLTVDAIDLTEHSRDEAIGRGADFGLRP
ncbi:E3 SUMO-protein ligase PIAS1-like [Rhipicephalus sanguineus]|uniref:E3 SUMO-protein ligase PIAS1-like n=1 Tax=Rhipicephalus sanguineus TaxID=34632 RepID=UPI0020C34317|nr:E3 SUMO-protein ligase PIAS1-like [Rhipicephalus sanguineus]